MKAYASRVSQSARRSHNVEQEGKKEGGRNEGGCTHVTHGARRLAALKRVRARLLVLAASPADLL